MSTARFDVAVVGAGVVGCAVARELARGGARCVLLEAGADVGTGTSKANTAIHHTGFDAPPGTAEAALVRRGHALLAEHAARAGIALEEVGAVLVAWDDEEAAALDGIELKARANGYTCARRLAAAELRAALPALGKGATAALAIPGEGIVCPWSTTISFATDAVQAGSELWRRARVTGVERAADGDAVLALADGRSLRASWVVNAAGLRSDEVDRLFGFARFRVTPRRGQLVVFDKLARALAPRIVLPVPTAITKGVLVAPTVYGNVLLGPTAEALGDKDDTASTAAGLSALRERGRRILPALLHHEVTAVYAGLRAATEHGDYRLFVEVEERYACAGGIRSTGLTASLAIAEHLAERLRDAGLELATAAGRAALPVAAMPPLGETQERPHRSPARIASDPAYGEVVCFCERVTRGELRDALASPVPPADLDGLRRRTRALNGRCQGFFCGARVRAQAAAVAR